MAGLKPELVREFYRLLRARGETATSLAKALGLTNHTYVSRLVHGHGRRRDGVWWPKLKALLTPDELALIAPEPAYAYPSLRDAVAALSKQDREMEPRRPANPTVAAFEAWRERRSA